MMLQSQLLHLLAPLQINKIRDLPELLQIQAPILHIMHQIALKIKDQALPQVALQILNLALHLDHLITLKFQDKVRLLNHPITLQTNQIKVKILIPKVQIRNLLKDKILMKPKNKKNQKQKQKQPQKLINYQQRI